MARLEQYLQLAQRLNICLKVNIEIDVGLHRGRVSSQGQFIDLLKLIQHSRYLKLSGLMGYDAHIAKLPKIIESLEKVISNTKPLFGSNFQIYGMQTYALTRVEAQLLCSIPNRANVMIWHLARC